MKYCPKCGKQLTDIELKFCPYCGSAIEDTINKYKDKSKFPKPLMFGIPIIIIVVIVMVAVNGLRGTSNSCEFGETCSFSDFDITTSNIEETVDGVKIDVEFMNNMKTTYPLSYSNFALLDNNEVAYSGSLIMNDNALSFESIISNSKKNFTVYFEKESFTDVKEIRFEGVSNGSYKIKLDGKAIVEENERLAKEKEKAKEKENSELSAKLEEDRQELIDNPPYILKQFPDLSKYIDCLYGKADMLKNIGFEQMSNSTDYRDEKNHATSPSHYNKDVTPWISINDYELLKSVDLQALNSANATQMVTDNAVMHTTKNGMIKFVYVFNKSNELKYIILATHDADISDFTD